MPRGGAYTSFLRSPAARQWKRVGARRRSAVATPLFSIRSEASVGVGELPDLKLLADWCGKTGIGIIQLLPMNDIGFSFRPYDAESSFALEPMHLSPESIAGVPRGRFEREIAALRKRFPAQRRFDVSVKRAKLELFARIHEAFPSDDSADFQRFRQNNTAWLDPYVAYRLLKEKMNDESWERWPAAYRDPAAGSSVESENPRRAAFHRWLQWQLFLQLADARRHANARGVLLMGDLPLLVSRDSADVWAEPAAFKLDLAAGAPPDLCFAGGQKWGMPPYDWSRIESDDYGYLVRKLQYAENFYDLFRIDHFVGLFRIWSIPKDASGAEGFFDPPDESVWEEHGRKIVSTALDRTEMLPCAEDLGTVPECSFKILREFGLPGMDVQRWTKTGWETYDFRAPTAYRLNSMATLSTHDLTSFRAWWEFEAGTVDAIVFEAKCRNRDIDPQWARERLFDESRSAYGRLRWKAELRDPDVIPGLLHRTENETGEVVDLFRSTFDEREKFWRFAGLPGDFEGLMRPALAAAALLRLNEASSVFSSALLQDWLSLGDALAAEDPWSFRINFPGTADAANWRMVLPLTLEEMLDLPINSEILKINRATKRVS